MSGKEYLKTFWGDFLFFIQKSPASAELRLWTEKMALEDINGNQYLCKFMLAGVQTLFTSALQQELTLSLRQFSRNPAADIIFVAEDVFTSILPRADKLFTNFYTNSENRLAIAACRAICKEDRLLSYNPLFLHGDTGLGKSHLLSAIAQDYRLQHPGKRVRYLTSDMFQSQFFLATKSDQLQHWRTLNTSADLFMMDDLHLLNANFNAMNEFLHLFDILHARKSQIVVTSLIIPKKLSGFPEALTGRLQWGLTIEIQKPELITREEIIRHKIQENGIEINSQLIARLAQNNSGNIRELEGSVNSVCSQVSLLEKEVNHTMINSIIKTGERAQPGSLMIEDIVEVVAEYFRLKKETLYSKSRIRSIAYPRQIGMYLAKVLTGYSLEEIGNIFGGRDHSTVKHGCEKIKYLCENDPSVKTMVDHLKNRVSALANV